MVVPRVRRDKTRGLADPRDVPRVQAKGGTVYSRVPKGRSQTPSEGHAAATLAASKGSANSTTPMAPFTRTSATVSSPTQGFSPSHNCPSMARTRRRHQPPFKNFDTDATATAHARGLPMNVGPCMSGRISEEPGGAARTGCHLFRRERRPHRHIAPRECFADAQNVRRDARLVAGEPVARPSKPRRDLVADE